MIGYFWRERSVSGPLIGPTGSGKCRTRPCYGWGDGRRSRRAEVVGTGPVEAPGLASTWERDFARRRLTRQKEPEDDIAAQRPEIGDRHAREMAAKAAFVLAGLNI